MTVGKLDPEKVVSRQSLKPALRSGESALELYPLIINGDIPLDGGGATHYRAASMRAILIIPVLALPVLALPVCADTATQTLAACAPPSLVSWFSGASIGYLTGLEEPMYNLHAGVSNSCWTLGGWNVAIFGEVGYFQKNEDYLQQRPGGSLNVGCELEFLPLTCNVKFERKLADSLNIYCGAGIGAAWTEIELNIHGSKMSDSDWVFATQVFGGVNFNVTPNNDIYAGARWIHSTLGNDCLLEVGTRYRF